MNPLAAIPPEVTMRYQQGGATLTVRRAYCKGCKLCVEACPAHILALDDEERVVVDDIARCIFCGACAGWCPDFVFVVDRGPLPRGS